MREGLWWCGCFWGSPACCKVSPILLLVTPVKSHCFSKSDFGTVVILDCCRLLSEVNRCVSCWLSPQQTSGWRVIFHIILQAIHTILFFFLNFLKIYSEIQSSVQFNWSLFLRSYLKYLSPLISSRTTVTLINLISKIFILKLMKMHFQYQCLPLSLL